LVDASWRGMLLASLAFSLLFLLVVGVQGAGAYLVMYLSSEVIELLATHRLSFVVELVKWSLSSADMLPCAFLVLQTALATSPEGAAAAVHTQAAVQLLTGAMVLQASMAMVCPDLCAGELAEFRAASSSLLSGVAAAAGGGAAGACEPPSVSAVLGRVLSKYSLAPLSIIRWLCVLCLTIAFTAPLGLAWCLGRQAASLELLAASILVLTHLVTLPPLWATLLAREVGATSEEGFERAFAFAAAARSAAAACPALAALPAFALLARHTAPAVSTVATGLDRRSCARSAGVHRCRLGALRAVWRRRRRWCGKWWFAAGARRARVGFCLQRGGPSARPPHRPRWPCHSFATAAAGASTLDAGGE